jgi:diguanylate cyclase (GGDEF)-like protein
MTVRAVVAIGLAHLLRRRMQAPLQTFPVLAFIGVAIQLAGGLALITVFATLRRFVVRRSYFTAWTAAWASLTIAVAALVARYILVPRAIGASLEESDPAVRLLYFIYQLGKCVGFVFLLRGTSLYLAGLARRPFTSRAAWFGVALFAAASAASSRHGLNEMIIGQSVFAVPTFGYCAWLLLALPLPRRTFGTVATGVVFALLGIVWLAYAGVFSAAIAGFSGALHDRVDAIVTYRAYIDLLFNLLLGYAMILVVMEDARREFDDTQAELRVTHDQLRRAALIDPLTDTLNRRAFVDRIGLETVRATFGAVVMADLDNLKIVNDRLGHAAGDRLLRRCADELRATLRPSDKLYRWGGDEFLLILPSAHSDDVLPRLRTVLDDACAVSVGDGAHDGPGDPVKLAVSFGAANFRNSDDLSTAIAAADRAMYEEKAQRKQSLAFVG